MGLLPGITVITSPGAGWQMVMPGVGHTRGRPAGGDARVSPTRGIHIELKRGEYTRIETREGTTKSFWITVFCSTQLVYIIATTFYLIRTCAALMYSAHGPFWAQYGSY